MKDSEDLLFIGNSYIGNLSKDMDAPRYMHKSCRGFHSERKINVKFSGKSRNISRLSCKQKERKLL